MSDLTLILEAGSRIAIFHGSFSLFSLGKKVLENDICLKKNRHNNRQKYNSRFLYWIGCFFLAFSSWLVRLTFVSFFPFFSYLLLWLLHNYSKSRQSILKGKQKDKYLQNGMHTAFFAVFYCFCNQGILLARCGAHYL